MAALDPLRDLGAGLARVTERWVPDAWVLCMMLTATALVVTRLRFGDIVAYTFLVVLVCFAVSLVARALMTAQL